MSVLSFVRLRWAAKVTLGFVALASGGPAAAQAAVAGLSFEAAQALALERAPQLAARRAALEGALAQRTSASQLPDPRLSMALENLPISGPMRFSLTAEPMTQRTFGWMQDMPNAGKRAARAEAAQARADREQAMLQFDALMVRRDVAQAWLASWFAQQRLAAFTALEAENRLLQETLAGRLAAGSAMPADALMARQEALMLADRRDELQRESAQAKAALRRWLDDDADRALAGEPPLMAVSPHRLHDDIPRHADLQAVEPMLRMAQADVAEAEAGKRGDWSWQVMYSRRASAFGDMVGVQFNFELPLWASERQDPQIRARRQETERIRLEREDMQRRRREEIDMQLAELDEAARMATRLQTQVSPLADERLRLAMAAYEAARGPLADVLTARRERAEIGLKLLQLQARQQALLARLNYLTPEKQP